MSVFKDVYKSYVRRQKRLEEIKRMEKIKKGDRIKLTGTQGLPSLTIGCIYVVLEVDCDDIVLIQSDFIHQRWWINHKNYKRLKPKLELQRLVDKVNAGGKAYNEILEKYSGMVREITDNVVIFQNSNTPYVHNYEVIPTPAKPKFEPYLITSYPVTWEVRLEDNNLHIGCRRFDARSLAVSLHHLIHEGGSKSSELLATKDGVKQLTYSETLEWKAAEELLKRLEAAGIK